MKEYIVKIISVENVTHDVKRFLIEKPEGYTFVPGQATEVSINTPALRNEARPFTFSGLNTWPHLELVIKIYPEHNGVTKALDELGAGAELVIRDVWGAITYTGPGWFIAGGAGITPFIAILRQLHVEKSVQGNHLIYSNKTARDIIFHDELSAILGNNLFNTLTRENDARYGSGRIDSAFLRERILNMDQHFYLCGPGRFVADIQNALFELGAKTETIVIER